MELKQAFDNVAAVYDALKSKLEHTYSCIVYISKRYDFIECRQFIVNESNRRLPSSCKMIDIVGIPELPRSAAVEIEVCGVTNEFRKIIKNWDTIEKNGNIQCNAIYIPTGFLSCSIKSELEHFNEDDILKMILNVLDKSKLTTNEVVLNIKEVKKPETNSYLVAENIAQQLVKRVSYRRAMKRAMQSALRLGAKGIKVFLIPVYLETFLSILGLVFSYVLLMLLSLPLFA